jgi:hypothetical protein
MIHFMLPSQKEVSTSRVIQRSELLVELFIELIMPTEVKPILTKSIK